MYALHAPPGLLLPVTAKLLHDLVRALHGDPDHRPHHVRESDARHVELDRGRVRPPGELPVKLGTQVERDPDRLRADRGLAGRSRTASTSLISSRTGVVRLISMGLGAHGIRISST